SKGWIRRATRDYGALDPQPILLQKKIVGPVVKTHRQVAGPIRTGRERHVGPAGDLQSVTVQEPTLPSSLHALHEQPTIGGRRRRCCGRWKSFGRSLDCGRGLGLTECQSGAQDQPREHVVSASTGASNFAPFT